MNIPFNQFKADLKSDKTLLGLWLGLGETFSAEICAGAGFDWLLIDGEHGPNDLRSILAQLQAVEPYASQAIVRPPQGDHVLIKQLLETGVQTLLIPMVETAEQAAGLVQAMRYPHPGLEASAQPWPALPAGGGFTITTPWPTIRCACCCKLKQDVAMTILMKYWRWKALTEFSLAPPTSPRPMDCSVNPIIRLSLTQLSPD